MYSTTQQISGVLEVKCEVKFEVKLRCCALQDIRLCEQLSLITARPNEVYMARGESFDSQIAGGIYEGKFP